MPGIEFAIQDILTIEKEHVVLRIDAVAAETARDPQVREGLREGDIDLVTRRDALRPRISDTPRRRNTKTRRESHDYRRAHYRACKTCYELTSSHIRPSSCVAETTVTRLMREPLGQTSAFYPAMLANPTTGSGCWGGSAANQLARRRSPLT